MGMLSLSFSSPSMSLSPCFCTYTASKRKIKAEQGGKTNSTAGIALSREIKQRNKAATERYRGSGKDGKRGEKGREEQEGDENGSGKNRKGEENEGREKRRGVGGMWG